jgi:hypothetical protein
MMMMMIPMMQLLPSQQPSQQPPAHWGISEAKRSSVLIKGGLQKHLGEDVGDLLLGEDVLEVNNSLLDGVTDPEVATLDVLESAVRRDEDPLRQTAMATVLLLRRMIGLLLP